jgi:hypothetical protein
MTMQVPEVFALLENFQKTHEPLENFDKMKACPRVMKCEPQSFILIIDVRDKDGLNHIH